MKKHKKITDIFIYFILTIGSVFMIGPLLWMITTSLKDKTGVFALPPQWIPDPFQFDAYTKLFQLDTL